MKSRNPSLAAAYSIKTKFKKPVTGKANDVLKSETMASTEERDRDATEIKRTSDKKVDHMSKMTDTPDRSQARKGMRTTPIKHPSMVPTSAFSARLRSEEDELLRSAKPNDGPQEEPPKHRDEEEADKSGRSSPDLKLKKMAKGGLINEDVPMHDAEEDDQMDPKGLESDDDEMSPEKGAFMAGKMMAEGGEVDAEHEEELEHHASVAAAIMAKNRDMKMMAEGGQVDIESNEMEAPEHETMDDRDESILKEHYGDDMNEMHEPKDSNEDSDSIESDKHDLVARIRAKMRLKSPMVK